MRKYITTSLLIASLCIGFTGSIGAPINTPYAKAATVNVITLNTPCAKVVSKSCNTVNLNINKVQGATAYKIYRACSKNGTYTCVGTTNNSTYKDAVKGAQTYYYKVKACKNGTPISQYSKTISCNVPKQTTGTTTPTTTPTTTATQQPVASTASNQSLQSYANEVLKLVNQERANAGLGALTTTGSLSNAANKRALEIVSSFSHTRPDGRSFSTVLADYSISYRAAGENIAEGQKTPSEVMNAWMNSPGHRANILGSQFGKIGIGVYKDSNGRYYWSQEFTN